MIYIRVEMWPKGDRKRAYLLTEATVENVQGLKTRADYLVRLSQRSGFKASAKTHADPELARVCFPRQSSVWKETTVVSFPRAMRGVWDLLYRGLCSCVGNRN